MDKNYLRGSLKSLGREIIYKEEIDSTNDEAKRLIEKKDAAGTVIISDFQSKGKGRLGRSWVGQKGDGIYISIIIKPSIGLQEISPLTLVTGLSVLNTIEKTTGLKGGLKWPNDVIINGKKICGILAELKIKEEAENFIIIGIGINADNSYFEGELQKKATSLFLETNKKTNKPEIIKILLEELEKNIENYVSLGFSFFLSDYKKSCLNLGREVMIIRGENSEKAFAEDIDRDGALVVKLTKNNERIKISSGEVSVRSTTGYI